MRREDQIGEIYTPFCIFALIVPAVNAAVGKNWLPTLITGLTAYLICTWLDNSEKEYPAGVHLLRIITIVFLSAIFLQDTHLSWPGRGAEYIVPLTLLLLAGYAVWMGNAVRGANVLRYGVYGILGALLLSGIGSVRPDRLMPTADYPDAKLAAVLLLPLLGRKQGGKRWLPLALTALAAALATAGTQENDLYRFSRGLSIDGVAERIESLTACAMTAGYYALLVFLLDAAAREARKMPGGERRWFVPLLLGIIYAVYLVTPQSLLPPVLAGQVILWGVVPLIWRRKKNFEKNEKRC